jgi:O-antigen/teichoic acid export membrane protein
VRKRFAEFCQRRFVRDTFVLQAATFVWGGTYFVTSVLTAHYLGDEQLGRWATAREIFMFAYFLLNLGVVTATVSYYSEAMGRQDRVASTNALAAMLKLGSLTALGIIGIGWFLGPIVGGHFYDDPQVGRFASVLCVAGMFEVVRGLAVTAMQGTRQMRSYALFDITTNVLRVGIVWGVLAAGWGVHGVVGAFVVQTLLAALIGLRFYGIARKADAKIAPPPLRDVIAAVPSASIRHIFGRSLLLAMNKSINTLVPRSGMLLIPALATFRDNGHYSIAYVLSWALALAMRAVTQTLLPTLGLKMGSENQSIDKMGGLLRRVSLVSGGLMIVATVLSVPVMYFVIKVFYGVEFEGSFEYFLWLVSGNLFIGFTVVADPFYIYSGRLRHAVMLNLLIGGLAILAIFLGGEFYGPKGVAAAAGLCHALPFVHLVYMWVYFRKSRARNSGSPGTGAPA